MADADVKGNTSHEYSVTSLSSCLRSNRTLPHQSLNNRSVSFPEDDNQIVTGYLDPPNPWEHAESVNKESVIFQYKKSCERHATHPISSVIKQIQEYDLCYGKRMNVLSLKGEHLSPQVCEPLEELFKRIQLFQIDLESTNLDDESSVIMFDMIEYYEAAIHLNISNNNGIGGRGWQACSRMLKRAKCLELLDCRGVPFTEQYMTILCRALKIGTHLKILKLDNCQLTGRPLVTLVAALKLNSVLKELYLGENELNTQDAYQLSALLKHNNTLQVLDVSNNYLEDSGLSRLLDGLIEQHLTMGSCTGYGLNMLVLWNNFISYESSGKVAKAIATVNSLEVLNIGSNDFGDQMLEICRDDLVESKSLLRIGMQSTNLTCAGALILASIISENNAIKRIDIRDNNIHIEGLEAVSNALVSNKSLTRLDIDSPKIKANLPDKELDEYTRLWEKIKRRCEENETSGRELEALERIKMRKISLTCNRLKLGAVDTPDRGRVSHLIPVPTNPRLRSPAPSPIPSPVASPPPIRTSNSRFQVSRVSEEESGSTVELNSTPSPPSSRFKVTVVDPVPQQFSDVAQGMVSRASRKLTSWVNPAQLLSESKTVEKILGLLPWSRGTQDLLEDKNSGATWPPQQAPPTRPPQPTSQHSASTPSLVHTS